LIGAPTYPMLRDTTQVAFVEILERNEIPYVLNRAENVLTLSDTGSRILFRSLEEYERLRGTNLAWFGVDELTYTEEAAWLRLESRLRDPRAKQLCGFAVWTPKGFDWVYRRFINPGTSGYEVVMARPMENSHVLRAAPDFYERLKTSYDADFYRQEVLGEYVEKNRARVYHMFDPRLHVQTLEFNSRLPLLWSLDFNVDPLCSIVAQIEDRTLNVIDEIVLRRATTKQACQEFAGRYGFRVSGVRVYGDASGWSMHTVGSSDYQIVRESLQRSGLSVVDIRVPKSNPGVTDRVAILNGKLQNANDEIELRIDRRCKMLIDDLAQVSYKDRSTIIEKDRDPDRTHASDALGYLVWQEFGERRRVGEQNRRLL